MIIKSKSKIQVNQINIILNYQKKLNARIEWLIDNHKDEVLGEDEKEFGAEPNPFREKFLQIVSHLRKILSKPKL